MFRIDPMYYGLYLFIIGAVFIFGGLMLVVAAVEWFRAEKHKDFHHGRECFCEDRS